MYSLKHSLQLIILRGRREYKKTDFVVTVYAVIWKRRYYVRIM